MKKRLLSAAVLSAVLALPSAASAHVTLEARQAVAGSTHKAVIRVPHGCEGSPTTAVRIRIPDGALGVKPQPKPGWTVSVVREKLPIPVTDAHGNQVTETVREVAWSGGRLLDEHYDEFALRLQLPATPNVTIHFPVVQQCEKGVHRWIEIPEAGRSRSDYREPAPELRLVPAPQ